MLQHSRHGGAIVQAIVNYENFQYPAILNHASATNQLLSYGSLDSFFSNKKEFVAAIKSSLEEGLIIR
ncbi:MAG TPA: hypothetical protein DCR17_00735 [Verrucomicrobiales bacterium]|nr:hypothetical protein [Verrucomicrobiales bacterium]